MSISVGIATGAAVQSAAASAEAAAAKKLACQKFVKDYQHETATTQERVDYAGCVGVLHPAPVSDGASMLIKAAIVILLLSTVVGSGLELRRGYGSTLERLCMGAIQGFLLSGAVLLFGGLAVAGVAFVFWG